MSLFRSPSLLVTAEELDPVARSQFHDSFLPPARRALVGTTTLRLGLHVHGVHTDDGHLEDLLHGIANVLLGGLGVHLEGVAAVLYGLVALLRDHRPDDHLTRVHQFAPPSRAATAASVSTALRAHK